VDPQAEVRLAEKLASRPDLADLPIRTRWACLRTFSADDRPAIGWDPALPGLYWVTALGGHGVTMSFAVGDLAAREILAGESSSAFRLERFTRGE
jgi:D-arginine dehydrogenase